MEAQIEVSAVSLIGRWVRARKEFLEASGAYGFLPSAAGKNRTDAACDELAAAEKALRLFWEQNRA